MRSARPERFAERPGQVRILLVRARQPGQFDDQRREDRDDDQQQDEGSCSLRDAITAKAAPEQLQRRARGDFRTAVEQVERGVGREQLGGACAHVSWLSSSRASSADKHRTYKFDTHGWPTCSTTCMHICRTSGSPARRCPCFLLCAPFCALLCGIGRLP
jgi:hypothetical protein